MAGVLYFDAGLLQALRIGQALIAHGIELRGVNVCER